MTVSTIHPEFLIIFLFMNIVSKSQNSKYRLKIMQCSTATAGQKPLTQSLISVMQHGYRQSNLKTYHKMTQQRKSVNYNYKLMQYFFKLKLLTECLNADKLLKSVVLGKLFHMRTTRTLQTYFLLSVLHFGRNNL